VQFYDRLRRIGAWLDVDLKTGEIWVQKHGFIPRWVSLGLRRHAKEIRPDLKRDIYGIAPGHDRVDLASGAQLVRLRRPEVKRSPPINRPTLKPTRQPERDDPPGAA
jgi:hypothetical protein